MTNFRNYKTLELTNSEYHDHEAISRSDIISVCDIKTPAHLKAAIENKDNKSKNALKFGHAFHCYILEPKFYEQFAVPYAETKSADTVKFRKAEEELKPDEFLVMPHWEHAFENMAKSIHSCETAKDILSLGGDIESSYFWWIDDPRGAVDDDGNIKQIQLKCRPDLFVNNVIVDLKKTNNTKDSADVSDFSSAAVKHGYHVQAYMNIMGIEAVTGKKPEGFTFLVVEDEAPYGVNLMACGETFLWAGEFDFKRHLIKYLEFKDKSDCYSDDLKILEAPDWFMNKILKESAHD